MKVLVIPDVHLKYWMFKRAAEIMRTHAVDKAVCLMDIPDNWNAEYDRQLYVDTFDASIEFQKKFPETLWCYGNHDVSYLWNRPESGYSKLCAGTVREKIEELRRKMAVNRLAKWLARLPDTRKGGKSYEENTICMLWQSVQVTDG